MIRDLNEMLRNGAASRRSFLRRSGVSMVAAGGVASLLTRSAGAAPRQFVPSKDPERNFFEQIQQHENDHVTFLVQALGSSARPEPTFQNLEQTSFAKFVEVSQALENTGVGAYLGAAPVIDSSAYLAAAGSILTIEARHSGWLNSILRDPLTGTAADPTSNPSFDVPLTPDQVDANAGPFIAGLNGGPPITYDQNVSSPENDIAILNFALALEYLERDFYNINVPKFYKPKKTSSK